MITRDGNGRAKACTRSTGFGPANMVSIRSSTIRCTDRAHRLDSLDRECATDHSALAGVLRIVHRNERERLGRLGLTVGG